MYGIGHNSNARLRAVYFRGPTSGYRSRGVRQMETTAWALIVLLRVAYISVIAMAALSLSDWDDGE